MLYFKVKETEKLMNETTEAMDSLLKEMLIKNPNSSCLNDMFKVRPIKNMFVSCNLTYPKTKLKKIQPLLRASRLYKFFGAGPATIFFFQFHTQKKNNNYNKAKERKRHYMNSTWRGRKIKLYPFHFV